MSDLQKLFSSHPTPEPQSDLADRIMAASRDIKPVKAANDNRWMWRTGFAAIAATVAFGFFMLSQPTETDEWESYAETAGFGDLYEWVHADES